MFVFLADVIIVDLPQHSNEEEVMDTNMIEQFFAVWPEDGQTDKGQMREVKGEHICIWIHLD